MHSSPTGELFLTDVRVGKDRLLGETEDVAGGGREGAKDTFSMERSGVAAMSLGIIERCLELSVQYAKDRVQFGQPIGEFQLIQDKLARMEVARLNVQNLVFRTIEMGQAGKSLTLAEASAMKLYSARAAMEVALEAVQLHGGNGYMAEFQVEQLARDAKVLQIYAGTDEIQITHIAKDLLRRVSAQAQALGPERADARGQRCRRRSRRPADRSTQPNLKERCHAAGLRAGAQVPLPVAEDGRRRRRRRRPSRRHTGWSVGCAVGVVGDRAPRVRRAADVPHARRCMPRSSSPSPSQSPSTGCRRPRRRRRRQATGSPAREAGAHGPGAVSEEHGLVGAVAVDVPAQRRVGRRCRR